MRQQEQQLNNDHPEAVRSTPVPVPPADDKDRTEFGDHDVTDADHPDRTAFDIDRTAGDTRDVTDIDDRERSDRDLADVDDRDPVDVDDRDQLDGDNRDLSDVDAATDRDHAESDPDRTRPWDGRPGDDGPEFHEPAPVPTAFGATTVGGAVAASALASPRPEDERDPRAEDTAAPGDGAVDGERVGRRADPEAEMHAGHVDEEATDGAGYGSAEPTMVDPDTRSSDDGGSGTDTSALTGTATLFDGSAAQGFRDRWRDVQLRFVDDPRAAAGEAQSLVDEAMQALSAALAEHKRKLGVWQEAGSTDTEQLRVAVREYRDFLDRVLGR